MRASPEQQQTRFQALYDVSYLDVLRFVQRRTQPGHAEDVVAETFLVVWRRIHDAPTHSGDLRAWTFGIARNLLLNERRGDRRREALTVQIANTPRFAQHPTADLDVIPLRIDLAVAWRQLSITDQEALALTLFDDLTSPQAARVLGITSAAYRLRLMRARRELGRLVEQPNTDNPATPPIRERSR